MPEPQVNRDRLDLIRPFVPRPEVADWEYRTAYVQFFQVRSPARLHIGLSQRAKEEQKALDVLIIEILERAVSRRDQTLGNIPESPRPSTLVLP